jgi:hypothetical protein
MRSGPAVCQAEVAGSVRDQGSGQAREYPAAGCRAWEDARVRRAEVQVRRVPEFRSCHLQYSLTNRPTPAPSELPCRNRLLDDERSWLLDRPWPVCVISGCRDVLSGSDQLPAEELDDLVSARACPAAGRDQKTDDLVLGDACVQQSSDLVWAHLDRRGSTREAAVLVGVAPLDHDGSLVPVSRPTQTPSPANPRAHRT